MFTLKHLKTLQHVSILEEKSKPTKCTN